MGVVGSNRILKEFGFSVFEAESFKVHLKLSGKPQTLLKSVYL